MNTYDICSRYTGAVILKAAYGYTASPENDYFIRLAEENMKLATLVVTPGQWVVDSLPFRTLATIFGRI